MRKREEVSPFTWQCVRSEINLLSFPDRESLIFIIGGISLNTPAATAEPELNRSAVYVFIENLNFSDPPAAVDLVKTLYAARALHTRLLQIEVPYDQKAQLARQIVGALFMTEANAQISNRARILFFRLRTCAHLAALPETPVSLNHDAIWADYKKLEGLL